MGFADGVCALKIGTTIFLGPRRPRFKSGLKVLVAEAKKLVGTFFLLFRVRRPGLRTGSEEGDRDAGEATCPVGSEELGLATFSFSFEARISASLLRI